MGAPARRGAVQVLGAAGPSHRGTRDAGQSARHAWRRSADPRAGTRALRRNRAGRHPGRSPTRRDAQSRGVRHLSAVRRYRRRRHDDDRHGLAGAAPGPTRGGHVGSSGRRCRCGSSWATARRWTWRGATWRTPRKPRGTSTSRAASSNRSPSLPGAGRRARRRFGAQRPRRCRGRAGRPRRGPPLPSSEPRQVPPDRRSLGNCAGAGGPGQHRSSGPRLCRGERLSQRGAPGLSRAGPSARRRSSAGVVVLVRRLPGARRRRGCAGECRGGDTAEDRDAGQAGRAGKDRPHAGGGTTARQRRGVRQRLEGGAHGDARSGSRNRDGCSRDSGH